MGVGTSAGSATAGFIITDASVARIGRVARIPVASDWRCRRGGNGGNRRLHALHALASSRFSALQNGQNRM